MRLEKLVRLLKISRRFELGTVKWIAKTLNFTQEFYFLQMSKNPCRGALGPLFKNRVPEGLEAWKLD